MVAASSMMESSCANSRCAPLGSPLSSATNSRRLSRRRAFRGCALAASTSPDDIFARSCRACPKERQVITERLQRAVRVNVRRFSSGVELHLFARRRRIVAGRRALVRTRASERYGARARAVVHLTISGLDSAVDVHLLCAAAER